MFSIIITSRIVLLSKSCISTFHLKVRDLYSVLNSGVTTEGGYSHLEQWDTLQEDLRFGAFISLKVQFLNQNFIMFYAEPQKFLHKIAWIQRATRRDILPGKISDFVISIIKKYDSPLPQELYNTFLPE